MTISPTLPSQNSPRGSEEIDTLNTLTILVEAVNKGLGLALVASLPLSPTDGEEVLYLADSANGVIWHLKYRAGASGAYKWEFVGGSSLFSEVATDETTASGVYTALATVGPSVTVPLAGDYDVAIAADTYINSVGATAYMSYDIGATNAVDADAAVINAPVSNYLTHLERTRRKTALPAAAALVLRYKTSAGTAGFVRRSISARPVRVG